MVSNALSPEVLAPIRVVFFEECEELLVELEAGLLALKKGERDTETVNTIFRAVHSIKGGAASFALNDLVAFAHRYEALLSDIRAGNVTIGPELLDCLLKACDVLADLVRATRDGRAVEPRRAADIAAALAIYAIPRAKEPNPTADEFAELCFTPVSADTSETATSTKLWTIRFRPYASLYRKAHDPLLLLRELKRLGPLATRLDESALPEVSKLDPLGAYLAWTISLTTVQPEFAIREVFEFVEGDCELAIEAAPETSAGPQESSLVEAPQSAKPPSQETVGSKLAQSIRVDLERVDRLVDLVGELVVNQAMLAQRLGTTGSSETFVAEDPLDSLNQLTRDIQESVLSIRAQPVKSVFQRMSRLVREVEAATGKRVNLVTEGEATEVDRSVIERLTDPLTHMIRNAIDHGIEMTRERLAAGKTEQGTICLRAAHRSGRIVVELSDDGRGIDSARVRATAIERGIISPTAELGKQDIDQLIFAPGFSTAAAISEISGRGVGLDVVKRGVEALGGRVSVSSEPGQGSTFILSLPLTLALLDGMLVRASGHALIVPLTALLETLQPRAGDVHRWGTLYALNYRGCYVPMVELACALGYRSPSTGHGDICILVENDMGKRLALLVDEILGQRQVVIKSLQTNYRNVPGIAAATILGDGSVALIVDAGAVVAEQLQNRTTPELTTVAA